VGAVAELTAKVQGKIEIIWRGTSLPAALTRLGAEGQVSGDTARAVIVDTQLDSALDALRSERCRIISVNPVRGTLEEYFMQQMDTPAAPDDGSSSRKGAFA
jgi:hypothetical protein